jgi:hypothetical protein
MLGNIELQIPLILSYPVPVRRFFEISQKPIAGYLIANTQIPKQLNLYFIFYSVTLHNSRRKIDVFVLVHYLGETLNRFR